MKRPVIPEEEATIIEHISTAIRRQRDDLEHGIRVSVPLGIVALCVVVIAYAIDKRRYLP